MPGTFSSLTLPDFGAKARDTGVRASLSTLTPGGPAYVYTRPNIDRATSAFASLKAAAHGVLVDVLDAGGSLGDGPTPAAFYVVPADYVDGQAVMFTDAKAHKEHAAAFAITREQALTWKADPKRSGSVVVL